MLGQEGGILERRTVADPAVRGNVIVGDQNTKKLLGILVLEATGQRDAFGLAALSVEGLRPRRVGQTLKTTACEVPEEGLDKGAIVLASTNCVRISVKVISGFGERDQGRKVVLRGQEIVA
ncbi:hypothetical protein TK49_22625 [Ralstonia mannitolilytica]|uniref:hypothetical protein n=1 Tax=Ralstonia mannitolilytica TaxID=105219 RepID=UPI0005D93FAA|nr:hypothetical protein [Ralstonia mannitolilytica]AJW47416.1 hypothetical protein TK49_22625 [Ralstonia mannitolilytica]